MSDEPSAAALTVAALKQRIKEYDHDRGFERFTNAVVRGAAVGVGARGGFYLVSSLVGKLRSKKAKKSSPTTSVIISNTLRYGAFMASFAGVYVATDEIIAILVGKRRSKGWRSLLAGGLAGPTLALVDSREANVGIAIYALLKGAVLMVRCGNLEVEGRPRRWLRAVLAPTRWQHGDTLLMCLNSAQIFYSWIMLPQTLPSTYVRFLNRHGGKTPIEYRAMRELSSRAAGAARPRTLRTLAGTPLAATPIARVGDFAFPGVSATWHAIRFLPDGVARAVPVYLPVYLVPALFVHRGRLLRPAFLARILPKLGVSIARSSLFLGVYCTLAWVGVCGFEALRGGSSGAVIAGGGFVSAAALLLEKKSRRMEIAIYTASRALESLVLTLDVADVIPGRIIPRRPDIAVFSLAMAAILHCYSDHYGERREVFRRQYLSAFDWILGNQGFDKACIQHSPSNLEYVHRVGSSKAGLLVRSTSRRSFDALRRITSKGRLAADGAIGGGGSPGGGASAPRPRADQPAADVDVDVDADVSVYADADAGADAYADADAYAYAYADADADANADVASDGHRAEPRGFRGARAAGGSAREAGSVGGLRRTSRSLADALGDEIP